MRKKYDNEHIRYRDRGHYYNQLYNKFLKENPELKICGIHWEHHGYQEIKIYIPRKGVLIYNETGTTAGKITWLDRYADEKIIKQRDREERSDMYQRFLSEIDIYQKRTGASQGTIAEITGISRQSINKYISGIVPPKVSTMRKIANSLGIDI